MELKRLEEFVTLRQGLAINNFSAHLVSEKKDNIFIYPLLRIADMMEKKYDKYISKNVNPNVIVKEDDIIYTRTGQIGLAFKGYKGVVHNNSFIVSIVNDKLDKDYLFVVLNSDFVRKQAINLAKNSVQPDLTHNMFKSIIIPVPSKKEQKNIAYYYKIVTKKIENNNKINKELEQLSKTIYNYWFLQFDFPDENGRPYKSSGGKMVWNEFFKREIPKGWEVQNLKDNNLTNIIIPGIQKFNSNKIYLATADVNKNNIVGGNIITFENRESRANMQPLQNSIWFAKMKDSIKHIFVGNYSDVLLNKYIFSTGFLGLICSNDYSYEYICSFINTEYFEIFKDKIAHGATQEAVNNDDIKFIPIMIPSKKVLLKYHEATKNIFKKIYLKNQENEELKSLRDFLLPLLMNGQVTLKKIQKTRDE